jgi:hypothetical protein
MPDELMDCDKLRTSANAPQGGEMDKLIQSKQWDFRLR